MSNICTHLATQLACTHPSHFSCRRSAYSAFTRKLRRAICADLCARTGVRASASAAYLCCLLFATASLTLSTECNCFCTGTSAARQVCSKHPLIKRCLAESLSVLLVTRCTATIALPQLLSDKPAPNIRSLSVSSLNRLLFDW